MKLFRFLSVLFICSSLASSGELILDRGWLAATAPGDSLTATLPGPDPDAFQLIQSGQMKVLWDGALLETQPILNKPSFRFTVPRELRHPGFTKLHLWDAARGLPLAYEARVAVIVLSNAEVFEASPEINRIAAYEPEEEGGNGGRIALYELSTGILLRAIPLAAPQQVLVFTPDLSYAWIAQDVALGSVSRFSLATEAVDQAFQVSFGFPPYDKLEAQVDRSDSRLLIVSAERVVRAFRDGALLPGIDSGVDVFPLPQDDQGRYAVASRQACRLDPQLGFVECQPLVDFNGSVKALWKDKLAHSRGVMDATTGEELLGFPLGDPFYLPESNRLFVSNLSRAYYIDGDSLEIVFEDTAPAWLAFIQKKRITAPDWLLARVHVSLPSDTNGEFGILFGHLAALGPTPTFSDSAVVHGAAFSPGAIAPGQIVSIFGEHLGPQPGASLLFENQLRLSPTTGGVQVLFEGEEGTVLYAGAGQINVVAPNTLEGQSVVQVQVIRDHVPSERFSVAVTEARPGLFGYVTSGRRYAAALHGDGRLQGPASPLLRGSPVSLFGSGLGLPAGLQASRIADRAALTPVIPSVTIGGKQAEVLYSGAAPGLTAGLFQVNAVIPLDAPVGPAVEVVVEANGLEERNTWLAIQ